MSFLIHVQTAIRENRAVITSLSFSIIGSDNGLSPGRRQAIIWTNAGILLIEPLGTNFTEIFNEIQTYSPTKFVFESVVCQSDGHLVLGLNVLSIITYPWP